MTDLSYSQLEDITEAFEVFSRTGNQEIRYEDFGNVLRALNLNPTEEDVCKVLNNPSSEEMSSKMLTYDEFLPLYAEIEKIPSGTYDDILEGLRVFDKEGNGIVMGVEIRHVLRTLGERMTREQVDDVMQGHEDISGAVNVEPFCKFLITEQLPEEDADE